MALDLPILSDLSRFTRSPMTDEESQPTSSPSHPTNKDSSDHGPDTVLSVATLEDVPLDFNRIDHSEENSVTLGTLRPMNPTAQGSRVSNILDTAPGPSTATLDSSSGPGSQLVPNFTQSTASQTPERAETVELGIPFDLNELASAHRRAEFAFNVLTWTVTAITGITATLDILAAKRLLPDPVGHAVAMAKEMFEAAKTIPLGKIDALLLVNVVRSFPKPKGLSCNIRLQFADVTSTLNTVLPWYNNPTIAVGMQTHIHQIRVDLIKTAQEIVELREQSLFKDLLLPEQIEMKIAEARRKYNTYVANFQVSPKLQI